MFRFFLSFCWHLLACSVSICDGLMFYCSLLMPVCYRQHSMKTSPAIGGRVQENSAMLFLNWRPVKDKTEIEIFQQMSAHKLPD